MENKLSLFELLSSAEKFNDDKAEMAGLFNNYLSIKSNKIRKPFSVQMELLPVCNFKCGFCYVRKTKEEIIKSGQHIMRFDEWKYYIDECLKLGLSGITFSGGECTLHPDFKEIYEYAYKKEMRVSLITNGSCITDEIFECFEKYPPTKISITLYGMSRDTYERTCGNGAAFEKVIKNIERLTNRGFNVIINYTAGKENFCDMEAVLAFARERRLSVFPSDLLMSSENCNNAKLENELVDHKKFKEIENRHYSILRKISFDDYQKSYFTKCSKPVQHKKKGLLCSAGKSMFSINWLGMMTPCVSFDKFRFDTHKLGFEKCWKQLMEWSNNIPVLEECENCIFQKKCPSCVALHYGDTGEFGKVSSRLCFKKIYPEEAAKMQAEYDRQQAEKSEETNI